MTEKDTYLIDKIKEGNRLAFNRLVLRYRVKVFNICYNYVHDSFEAEDISQEVFIQVYHSIHKFKNKSNFYTWLYKICINKSLNYIRAKKRCAVSIEKFKDLLIDKTELPFENENEINNKRISILKSGLRTLPENQQTALLLNRYNNLSYKEIAEIMEISKSSVESLIYRAKQNLRKYIVDNIK